MKVMEKRGGSGVKAGGGGGRGGGWSSLEVSTLVRIMESNTWRVRNDAGGQAQEDSIIQACEAQAAFKIMSVGGFGFFSFIYFLFFFASLLSQLDPFPSCSSTLKATFPSRPPRQPPRRRPTVIYPRGRVAARLNVNL